MNRSESRRAWRKASLLYAALMAILAVIPTGAAAPDQPGFDKVAHLIELFIFAWLLTRARYFDRRSDSRRRVFFSLWAGAFGYGLLLEAWQGLIPWRTVEFADILMNAAGAMLGAAFVLAPPRAPKAES